MGETFKTFAFFIMEREASSHILHHKTIQIIQLGDCKTLVLYVFPP